MIQLILKKGKISKEDVPLPKVARGTILVKVMYSCISTGTEIAALKATGGSLFRMALEQPGNIAKGLQLIKEKGIFSVAKNIKEKISDGSPVGYSVSGIVLDTGESVKDFTRGERVACAGTGYANHAEYVEVPYNLAAKIPEGLDFAPASTVALGAIALQGIRRAQVELGEYVVVFGLGIIGQISLQLLKNAGCYVIGIDVEEKRLKVAAQNGADLAIDARKDSLEKEVFHFTGGYGADKVLFCASTDSSLALHQAFQLARKKAKVVLVGVSGMEINRQDLYAKELDFLVSCSYGPGRYEESYEEKGLDYPLAFVRWSENRNMQEYLKELSNKKIKLDDLIEKVYPIEKAPEAYEELQKPAKPIGVLLEYPKELPENLGRLYQDSSRIYTGTSKVAPKTGVVKIAIVGAGSFIKNTHIPNLLKLKDKFKICAVMSKTPYNAKQTAQLCGADYATCNLDDVLADAQIDLIFIGSPHNLHGAQILSALKAGKNVFVEKPLCVAQEELQAIKDFYSEKVSQNTPAPLLTVGFNRRFSPMAREAKIHTSKRINPLYLHYRMNAGFLPATHWVNQEEGAGRIIGEACHAVDLCTFFTESKVRGINVSSLSPKTQSVSGDDNKVIVLSYEDGSVATLEYFSVGSRAYPKEYVEIHFDEKTIVIDDFKSVNGYGLRLPSASDGSFRKGHFEELSALYDSLTRPKEKWPIELWDMIQTTEICILAARK